MMMLFAGDYYYPTGGMHDFRGYFNSEEDAKEYLEKGHFDWGHLATDGSIIWSWNRAP